MRSEGAHVALDHRADGYLEAVKRATDGAGATVILEMLANANLESDLGVAAPSGRIVVIGSRGAATLTPRLAMARDLILGIAYWNATARDDAEVHAGLAAGLEAGTLRPIVGKQFALGAAAAAHEAVMQPGAHGKIVLLP